LSKIHTNIPKIQGSIITPINPKLIYDSPIIPIRGPPEVSGFNPNNFKVILPILYFSLKGKIDVGIKPNALAI